MNFQDLKEKILTDIRYQLILIGFILFGSLIFIFKDLFFPSKNTSPYPCYRTNLVIWLPDFIDRESFLKLVSSYASTRCLKIDIIYKRFENMENDLIRGLAERESPDIIFARADFVYRNKKFLLDLKENSKKFNYIFKDENSNYGFPVAIDALALYYNPRIFDFFKIQPPKTLDELTSLLERFNQENIKDFYLIGFASSKVKNKKEIILVLQNLTKKPIDGVIDYYFSFNKDNKLLSKDFTSDIVLFANEKIGSFIGFYRDKKEINKLNPRLIYKISSSPIESFPPSSKNYVEVYYFVLPKGNKNSIALEFLNWFLEKRYEDFIKEFDLIPNFKGISVDEEKEVFIESAKYGSSYLEIISQDSYQDFDRILEIWETDREEGRKELIRSGLKF